MLSFSDRNVAEGKIERMIARKQARLVKRRNFWRAWNRTGKQWQKMIKGGIWVLANLTPIEQLRHYLKEICNKWETQYMVCWGNQLYDITHAEYLFKLDGLDIVIPDTDVITMYFDDGTKINLYPEGWGF